MQLYKQVWVSLSKEERESLANAFNLRRDEGTEVCNDRIISDGYSDLALSGITVESMQALTGSKTENFDDLLKETINFVMTPSTPATTAYSEPLTQQDVNILADNGITPDPSIPLAGGVKIKKTGKSKKSK